MCNLLSENDQKKMRYIDMSQKDISKQTVIGFSIVGVFSKIETIRISKIIKILNLTILDFGYLVI
jgi:hypothetical protein